MSEEKPKYKPVPPRGGSRLGCPNKKTAEFRATVTALLAGNSENVHIWLEQVANGHEGKPPDPARALDLLVKLADFAAPRMSRVEHVGDGGGPLQHITKIELVALSDDSESSDTTEVDPTV